MTGELVRPTMLAISLATAPSERGPGGVPGLRPRWDALASPPYLMTGRVFAAKPLAFPSEPELRETPLDDYEVLALREQPRATGLSQAFLYRRHDMVGLVLARGEENGKPGIQAWANWADEWTGAIHAMPTQGGWLGEFLIFTALCEGAVDLTAFWDRLRGALPMPVWMDHQAPVVTPEGLRIWGSSLHENPRVLVLLGAPGRAGVLDRCVWVSRQSLPPMISYLASAAKVRFEWDAHRRLVGLLWSGRDQLEGRLADVFREGLLEANEECTLRALHARQDRIHEAQMCSTGLGVTGTRLRELERSVAIAQANMSRARPRDRTGEPNPFSPFALDEQDAAWLCAQARFDAEYIDAVRERANEINTLSFLCAERERQERQHHQENVLRHQTMVLAAVGALIAAVPIVGDLLNRRHYTRWFVIPIDVGVVLAGLVLSALSQRLRLRRSRPARSGPSHGSRPGTLRHRYANPRANPHANHRPAPRP